ncbi:MAG: hypothetical protein ABIE68_04980 [bacterium]
MNKKSIIIIILIIVLAIGGYLIWKFTQDSIGDEDTKTEKTINSEEKTKTSNAGECAEVEKYNGTILDISSTSGKLEGQIGIVIDEESEVDGEALPPVKIIYALRIDEALPQKQASNDVGLGYHYIGSLKTKGQSGTYSSGSIGGAYCNKSGLPDPIAVADNLDSAFDYYRSCLPPVGSYGMTTETFYNTHAEYRSCDEFDYDALFNKDQFDIIDVSPFYYQENSEGYESWGIDEAKALEEGEIEATYKISVTE